MTGFNSQVGGGVFRVQFETDNQTAYKTVESVIRAFVDLEQIKTDDTTQVVVYKNEKTTCGVCEANSK